jgi:hypothetical protein
MNESKTATCKTSAEKTRSHLSFLSHLHILNRYGKSGTEVDHRIKLFTFRHLLRKFMPKTYDNLSRLGSLDDIYLNLMFVDFFRTLLPRSSIRRMIDCYLLEGDRILYRYALALIKGYKALAKKGVLTNSFQFWHTIQMDAASIVDLNWLSAGDDEAGAFAHNIQMSVTYKFLSEDIHDDAFDMNRSGIQKAYRPMHVSTKTIDALKRRALSEMGQMLLHSPLERPLLPHTRAASERARVLHPAVTSQHCSNDSGSCSSSPHKHQERFTSSATARKHPPTDSLAKSSTTPQTSSAVQSYILDSSTTLQVLMLCPFNSIPPPSLPLKNTQHISINDVGLQLVFSTARDGWNLKSLYDKVRSIAPLVILIKALGTKCIIGAYVTVPLAPPSTSSRGDGRCFCFRLDSGEQNHRQLQLVGPGDTLNTSRQAQGKEDINNTSTLENVHPVPVKFPWVGLLDLDESGSKNEEEYEYSSIRSSGIHTSSRRPAAAATAAIDTPYASTKGSARGGGGGAMSTPRSGTLTQFAVCTSSYISFGGSEAFGTNAIRLYDDLRTCSSGPSDTYGNEHSLFTDEAGEQQSVAFGVENVEVICTRNAYESALQRAQNHTLNNVQARL